MSINWNSNWLVKFESPLSVFGKLRFANQLSGKEFFQYYTTENPHNRQNFLLGENFNYKKLEEDIEDQLLDHFNSTIKNMTHGFLQGEFKHSLYCRKELFLCNQCAGLGYHSLLFQSKFIVNCPFHNIELTNQCRKCGMKLFYNFNKNHFVYECCKECKEPFFDHSSNYPNYLRYTQEDIKCSYFLEWMGLSEFKRHQLKTIHISGIESSQVVSLSFTFHILEQLFMLRGSEQTILD